ncbi:MAG: hypothetical protein ACI4FN_08445 [Acutalibacteraceae bacterium]
MKDSLVYKIHPSSDVGEVVRINAKTREILNQHKRETGLSATKILEEWAKFADKHYEVREV